MLMLISSRQTVFAQLHNQISHKTSCLVDAFGISFHNSLILVIGF